MYIHTMLFWTKHTLLVQSGRLLSLSLLTACLLSSSKIYAQTVNLNNPDSNQINKPSNHSKYEVILAPPTSHSDTQEPYKIALITAALEATRELYGDYSLFQRPGYMQMARAFFELERGTQINTLYSLTSRSREENTIPIRIPLRFGLLNYRLLLINKEKRNLFSNIQNTDDLRPLNAGIKNDWILKQIFADNEFGRVEVKTLESLYQMLNQGRFDYLIRGVNETFDELKLHEGEIDNVEILPNIALYINTPLYLFVSKTQPQLAKRLEHGLNLLLESGEMQNIFWDEYSDDIKLAELEGRKIIEIPNPLLPPHTPVERSELWYNSDSKFTLKP